MKLSAYAIAIAWVGLLAAATWISYNASRGEWAELARRWGAPPAGAPTQDLRRIEDVPADLRNQLTIGLSALTESLQSYQAHLGQ
jgi:hypothetical protein